MTLNMLTMRFPAAVGCSCCADPVSLLHHSVLSAIYAVSCQLRCARPLSEPCNSAVWCGKTTLADAACLEFEVAMILGVSSVRRSVTSSGTEITVDRDGMLMSMDRRLPARIR
jgi:hypothetical protein